MNNCTKMILATDIDGTFLPPNGIENSKNLYKIIKDYRDNIILIFVSGRGFENIIPLIDDPTLPSPDYIIADVGATVLKKDNDIYAPVMPLQKDIAAQWPDRSRIMQRLDSIDGITAQEVPQERRCSFYYDNAAVLPKLESVASELDLSLIASAGKYIDFLPKGVNKGSTLKKLIKKEHMDPKLVMVAGDTLNDLSMMETGYKGCIVGNSEPMLKSLMLTRKKIYQAHGEGPDGIVEAMRHHGFNAALGVPIQDETPFYGKAKLVMVYHRQPFDEAVRGHKQVRQSPKSPNGIIPTLLGFFSSGQHGAWVAWSQQKSRAPKDFEIYTEVDKEKYPNLIAARVALTAEDVNRFYKQFSKESLWPIIFSFPGRVSFIEEHWKHFCEINELFAQRTAAVAAHGATIWIHDYNLWMTPSYLRDIRPDLKIAFFHHTSFPGADIFNIIPWKREIITSLLKCDYVGFHIPRYVVNFIDVVRSNVPVEVIENEACAPKYLTYGCALGVEEMPRRIKTPYGALGVGAHPVGIDNAKIATIVSNHKERIEKIQQEAAGRKIILSVERLDYVKGSIEKMLAFEAFLDQHPEWHNKIMMINITTPAASGMDVYKITRDKLDQIIGRINGRYSNIDWNPVKYFFRSIAFDELVSYYAAADIAWITPLRDGLNLVCKEYISAKAASRKQGVLVLSEFAGAAVELKGAVLTNPYDLNSMTLGLLTALKMDEQEITFRMNELQERVHKYNVTTWGADFLNFECAFDSSDEQREAVDYEKLGSFTN